MRKTLVLLAAFCVLPGFEQPRQEQVPSTIEEWRCVNEFVWLALQFKDGGYEDIPEDDVIVTLTRRTSKGEKSGFGEVSVTGITHRASFSVEGLERRWDFGENREYAFFINPQGGGAYYDFSGSEIGETVEPSQTYGCLSNRAHKNKETRELREQQTQASRQFGEMQRRQQEEAEAAQRQIEETERRRREAELAERMRREMEGERRRQAIESDQLDEYSSSHAVESDYLPIVKVAPMYPRRAQSRGLEGYCDLQFTVTPLGTTADVSVIECTSSLFEQASVQALLKFKYKPIVVNGTAIAIPGLQHRITFQIED